MSFPHKNWCRQFRLVFLLRTYFLVKRNINYMRKNFLIKNPEHGLLLLFLSPWSTVQRRRRKCIFQFESLYEFGINSVSISLSCCYFKNSWNSKGNKNLIWNTITLLFCLHRATLVTLFYEFSFRNERWMKFLLDLGMFLGIILKSCEVIIFPNSLITIKGIGSFIKYQEFEKFTTSTTHLTKYDWKAWGF